jgi:hypothetical protein
MGERVAVDIHPIRIMLDRDCGVTEENLISARVTPGRVVEGKDWRDWVGPLDCYDRVAAVQFNVMCSEGLRGTHEMLDIGCGSLRGGRLFIVYLDKNAYHGVEPEEWLVEDGIKFEVGKEMVEMKGATFSNNSDFDFRSFGHEFDYLLAQSIFSHTSEEQTQLCMDGAREVMHDKSVFIANFLKARENSINPDGWKSCNHLSFEYLVEVARRAGLTCEMLDYPHPNSLKWVRLEKM